MREGSAATINGNSFTGNVVAQAVITMAGGASLTGRALATTGPMTLATNTSVGGSSTPPPSCPTVTLSPATGGTVGVAFNQTIAGSGGAVAVHLHYHQRYPARGLYAHRVRRAGVDADHRGIVHL